MKALELLDKVRKFYSVPENGPGFHGLVCSYHVSSSAKCAIGCLLDDSVRFQAYADRHSNSAINLLYEVATSESPVDEEALWVAAQIRQLFPRDIPYSFEFLSNLQGVHDRLNPAPLDDFKRFLNRGLDGIISHYSL